ncbi:GlxA family transcriptional regulator [Pseudomonas sp. GV071]|jgi:transcriptional regulator GlxA family with amidase domain|uniref:GlxA family transcriptional regulator n=1 Tax=Pseudomonas sp. GV071 TaxID=2135754 RepID=UPI000D3D98C6|nr:helix-turn-helix domain-containing protein [Pseudomonas sp. GV071]PTQ69145.1 AraC family transcriptional regulator with amidase-like domain [Pseudomonas sp. GV071]
MQRRDFSDVMKNKNYRYLDDGKKASGKQARVGFLLLEHFSLPAFTQALDTLITANLLQANSFAVTHFSLDGNEVISDLGLVISPDAELNHAGLNDLNMLVVCGGYRTPLHADKALMQLLRDAARLGMPLGGLWNGAWFLGHAGLLDGYRCAIHPEHRSALVEVAKRAEVTSESYVIDRDRLTASSASGAPAMILEWIKQQHTRALVDGIEDILAFEASRYRRVNPKSLLKISDPTRQVVELMEANLEELLELDQLAEYVGRSRRQVERLFREQLGTTPQRYYLELRITEARRLLQHSKLSVADVGLACGFVTSSHFSRCYSSYYGYRPSKEKRLV